MQNLLQEQVCREHACSCVAVLSQYQPIPLAPPLPCFLQIEEDVRKEQAGKEQEQEELPEWELYKQQVSH